MKLLHYVETGSERPGLLHFDGTIRDLSAHVLDIDATTLLIGSNELERRSA